MGFELIDDDQFLRYDEDSDLPRMKKNQKKSTLNTKRRILKGATKAFAQKGYYGATMREISRECKFEQSSIYYHFGEKANLFRSCLFFAHKSFLSHIERNVDRGSDLFTEVYSVFVAINTYNQKHPAHIFLIFSLVYSAPKEIANDYTSIHGGDFRSFVETAFRRSPPAKNMHERKSLVIDMLYSFILSLSAQNVKNDRRAFLKRSLLFLEHATLTEDLS